MQSAEFGPASSSELIVTTTAPTTRELTAGCEVRQGERASKGSTEGVYRPFGHKVGRLIVTSARSLKLEASIISAVVRIPLVSELLDCKCSSNSKIP